MLTSPQSRPNRHFSSFKPTPECAWKVPTRHTKTKASKSRWWTAAKTTNTRSGFSFQLSGID